MKHGIHLPTTSNLLFFPSHFPHQATLRPEGVGVGETVHHFNYSNGTDVNYDWCNSSVGVREVRGKEGLLNSKTEKYSQGVG